jgi:hypothetical protein
MKNIVVAISELSGRIYAGVPLRSGVWGAKKTDVTDMCIFAVTQLLNEEGPMVVTLDGKNFEIHTKETF